ncbi:alpha/beta hydrolase [Roseiarcaceae bacterium H3SJ34-1]|uniref:alpha/beta hydrolase n=1 Tax=Terripilifer ovatus TaxID=3032367 RepID=UPI003AB92B40|nr:alpha/beta hydrolase [Roseiarcaceae bacterium H3SJ34-1]
MKKLIHGFLLDERPAAPHPAAAAYSDLALELSARPQPGIVAHRDVVWGDEPWQRFDVFAPAQSKGSLPVLIFIHGGGWMSGYKEWTGFMAPGVIASGAILVATTYRLAPAHRLPTIIDDCIEAVAAVRARVAEFGGDASRFYLSGHSAGGHLAMMVALRNDLWKGRLGSELRGILPISGILDLHHDDPQPGSLEELAYLKVLQHPQDDVSSSPVSFAALSEMPIVLGWGSADTERVLRSNELMAWLLEKASAPFEVFRFEGADHFQTHLALADPDHPWYAALARMLGK